MSHFSVIVVGENIEEQLAPFHEYECTGQNDQYVQDIDKTEEAKEEYQSQGDGESFVDFVQDWYGIKVATEDTLDTDGADSEHKYGYVLVDAEGNVLKVVRRTNPNAKWDWYVTGHGSRFQNRLLHKDGFKTDQILKGDVDFEKMKDDAGKEAAERWQITRDALTAANAPLWESWEVIRERNGDNIDAAREEYNNQPGMKAVQQELWAMGYYDETDAHLADLDAYVLNARNKACVPFAILKDGQWYERGRMGWWAIVSDEDGTWDAKAVELLEALPDDTMLTVVDCHI